jgi:hypothetical protein
VRLLLEAGADPNFTTPQGETSLHQAADTDSEDIVRLLLDYGASANAQQGEGETPLHYAAYKGSASCARLLLERGADPDTPNSTLGWTPLHYACDYDNLELVRLLLAHGANDAALDVKRRRPADLAKGPLVCKLFGSPVPSTAPSRKISMIDEDFKKLTQLKSSICETLKETSSFVTEAETRRPRPRNSPLYTWLLSLRLEELHDQLIDAGCEDLDFMLAQMKGERPMTLESMQRLGVYKLGWRMRFLAFLSEEAQQTTQQGCRFTCSKPQASPQWLQSVPTLRCWLANLSLSSLLGNFEQAGLDDLDQLMMLMNTAYPVTDATLRTIGVDKPGHRARILARLQDESRGVVYSCRLRSAEKGACCRII